MGKKADLPSQLAAMDSSRRARRGVTDDSMDSERKRFPGEFLCELMGKLLNSWLMISFGDEWLTQYNVVNGLV